MKATDPIFPGAQVPSEQTQNGWQTYELSKGMRFLEYTAVQLMAAIVGTYNVNSKEGLDSAANVAVLGAQALAKALAKEHFSLHPEKLTAEEKASILKLFEKGETRPAVTWVFPKYEPRGKPICPECRKFGRIYTMLCDTPTCGPSDTYRCSAGHVLDHHPAAVQKLDTKA